MLSELLGVFHRLHISSRDSRKASSICLNCLQKLQVRDFLQTAGPTLTEVSPSALILNYCADCELQKWKRNQN